MPISRCRGLRAERPVMSGMDSIGKVWDGYEWVLPEAVPKQAPHLPTSLAEPSTLKWGLAADAFREKQEAQRKLNGLMPRFDVRENRRAYAAYRLIAQREPASIRRQARGA